MYQNLYIYQPQYIKIYTSATKGCDKGLVVVEIHRFLWYNVSMEIEKKYAFSFSVDALCEEFGLARMSVYRRLPELLERGLAIGHPARLCMEAADYMRSHRGRPGRKPLATLLTDQEIAELQSLYEEHRTIAGVARALDISWGRANLRLRAARNIK
jgi:hypothetical protein